MDESADLARRLAKATADDLRLAMERLERAHGALAKMGQVRPGRKAAGAVEALGDAQGELEAARTQVRQLAELWLHLREAVRTGLR